MESASRSDRSRQFDSKRSSSTPSGRLPREPRRLRDFTGIGYDKGRGIRAQVAWLLASELIVTRWWCPVRLRVAVLRAFGAELGERVLIRQVRVHWPWKLTIGDDCWIGAGAWLYNPVEITIGSNVCISQEAMLCSGAHDPRSPSLEVDCDPVVVEDGVWVAVRATVLKGVTLGEGAVVGACALVTRDVPAGGFALAPVAQVRDGYE